MFPLIGWLAEIHFLEVFTDEKGIQTIRGMFNRSFIV